MSDSTPGPLTQHALSHVLSDLAQVAADDHEGGPLTEEDVRDQLRQAGYLAEGVQRQVWAAYVEGWPTCAVCDELATHLWGTVCDGVISSIAGAWTLAPSCDGCSGNKFDDGTCAPVVRAPLNRDPKIGPPDRGTTIEQQLLAMDPGDARIELVSAVRAFARVVATRTRGEIHQFSWSDVILDIIGDVLSSQEER